MMPDPPHAARGERGRGARKPLLGRLRALFTGWEWPPDPPFVNVAATEFTFQTPSRDDGYDFIIGVRCDWTGDSAVPRRAMLDRVGLHERGLPDAVKRIVRPVARQHPAYQPAEAEAAVNSALRRPWCPVAEDSPAQSADDCAWCGAGGTRAPGCGLGHGPAWAFDESRILAWVSATVTMAEPVQANQQQATLVEQGRSNDFALERLQVDWVHMLIASWRRVLGDLELGLEPSGLAPYAARLALNPQNLAKLVDEIVNERREHYDDLRTLVENTIEEYKQLGVYEYVVLSDSALSIAMRKLELSTPRPNLDADSGRNGGRGDVST